MRFIFCTFFLFFNLQEINNDNNNTEKSIMTIIIIYKIPTAKHLDRKIQISFRYQTEFVFFNCLHMQGLRPEMKGDNNNNKKNNKRTMENFPYDLTQVSGIRSIHLQVRYTACRQQSSWHSQMAPNHNTDPRCVQILHYAFPNKMIITNDRVICQALNLASYSQRSCVCAYLVQFSDTCIKLKLHTLSLNHHIK